jgi:hypothetical protein
VQYGHESMEYQLFINGPIWARIRKRFLELHASSICTGCRTTSLLDVHHLTYTRFGGAELPSDLMALCRTCHREVHDFRNQKVNRNLTMADATEWALGITVSRTMVPWPDVPEKAKSGSWQTSNPVKRLPDEVKFVFQPSGKEKKKKEPKQPRPYIVRGMAWESHEARQQAQTRSGKKKLTRSSYVRSMSRQLGLTEVQFEKLAVIIAAPDTDWGWRVERRVG